MDKEKDKEGKPIKEDEGAKNSKAEFSEAEFSETEVSEAEFSEAELPRAEFPRDLKRTRPREILWRILKDSRGPVSAADLYEGLLRAKESGSPAFSTVYRALSAFEEKGYVLRTTLPGEDTAYYEWNRGGHVHYAVCLKCRKRIPLHSCPCESGKLTADVGEFTVTGHKLELYGYCGCCKPRDGS